MVDARRQKIIQLMKEQKAIKQLKMGYIEKHVSESKIRDSIMAANRGELQSEKTWFRDGKRR